MPSAVNLWSLYGNLPCWTWYKGHYRSIFHIFARNVMRCTLQWTDCWLKLPCLTHLAFLEPLNVPWKVWIRSIKNKLKLSENYIKCNNVGYSNIEHDKFVIDRFVQWASYQIRNIAGCACAGNAGNVFPRRRLQRKSLVSDPGMHHGTCGTHVPWCMSGSLASGGGENVPGIPGVCAPAIFRIWQEAHSSSFMKSLKRVMKTFGGPSSLILNFICSAIVRRYIVVFVCRLSLHDLFNYLILRTNQEF